MTNVRDTDTSPTRPSVLIADDDAWACKAYQRMLEKEGYDVLVAHNGGEAADLLEKHPFDAVLSDIVLGDDNGISLLEKSQKLSEDTPVILITGNPSVETAAAAVRLGAYDYLPKPILKERLCHTISKAIEMKHLKGTKKRIERENLKYQRNLEELVSARTERLIKSNYRFQLLFENSKDAIFMATWEGTFLELNKATEQLFGYPKEELMAGNIAQLYTDRKQYERFHDEIDKKGFVKDFSIKFNHADGSVIDCLLTANLLSYPDGGIEGYQGIVRDITPQKQAERKIKAQNQFLTNVIESLAHPFLVIGAKDYTVKIANTAARRKHPEARETCYALNHGFDRPCSDLGRRCPLDEVVRTHRSAHLEYHHKDRHGNVTDQEEVHAYPLFDDDGHVRQVIQYRLDITHRKRLETIAEAANLMENLGFIFSGIRHEIGNPINSIKMALSVLSKNLETYPPETVREFVDRSLGEISRVEYLLKALKNFSLYDTPDLEPISMGPFMTHFLSLVEKDFAQKQIQIQISAPRTDAIAMADQRMLHQLMLNLLTNAADALDTVDHPRIDVVIESLADYVQVKVIDNGCGMPDAEQNHLFRPFYTSKPHGTGLGLVIVKKMLSKMKGTIRIDSKRNHGTTVAITLPYAAEPKTT